MNMQDQITHFEKLCANTFDKEKKPQGVAMPKQMASALPMLEFGKRYLFANHKDVPKQRLLRNFILWHLVKDKHKVVVVSTQNLFEQDFYALLERESRVENWKIRAGLLGNKEQVALLEALERMRGWKIEWKSAADISAENETAVLVITLSKANWQADWETISRNFLAKCPQGIVLGFLEGDPSAQGEDVGLFYREEPSFPEKRADVFCFCRRSTLAQWEDEDIFEGPFHEEPIVWLQAQDNTKLANAGVDILIKDLLGF